MIDANSRYSNDPVISVSDPLRGEVQAISGVEPFTGSLNFTYYQIEEFDTLDFIAYSVLGDGSLWWRIADANPEILDWEPLPIGQIIRIPKV